MVPYRGDEPYTFVCYSHRDAAVVLQEMRRLQEHGINVFYDEGIAPGHEWTQDLAEAIDGCSRFLFFISPAAVSSRHCRNEVQYALEKAKQIVSVYLEPTELPGGLLLSIGSVQAILKHALKEADYQRKIYAALSDAVRTTHPVEAGSALSAWSVAVLPFINASNDPEQDFFCEGIAEDVLNTLAQSADLVVRPRSSSFAFKTAQLDSQSIGKQLNVTHVLEGSVRKAGDRVRISAQLIEVANNHSVWSGRFDRRLHDIFEIQDEITRELLTALDVVLGSRRLSQSFVSEEAYEAFLRARYAHSQYDFTSAEDWLAKAVTLDPGNAEAWAFRADVNAYQSAMEISPNYGMHRDRRRHYVQQALALDPAHPNAIATRALMDTLYTERHYQEAINELVHLSSAYPNNELILTYLTFTLATIGRADLVDRATERLIRLAPWSPNAWTVRIFYGRLMFGALEKAKADLARFPGVRQIVGAQIAIAERDPLALAEFVPKGDWGHGVLAIYAVLVPYLSGDFQKAEELAVSVEQTDGYQSHRLKSFLCLIRQDLDGAFAQYRNAILAAEQMAIGQVHGPISWRRVFPEYFADPRYQLMLEEFHLDPVSTAAIQVPDFPF